MNLIRHCYHSGSVGWKYGQQELLSRPVNKDGNRTYQGDKSTNLWPCHDAKHKMGDAFSPPVDKEMVCSFTLWAGTCTSAGPALSLRLFGTGPSVSQGKGRGPGMRCPATRTAGPMAPGSTSRRRRNGRSVGGENVEPIPQACPEEYGSGAVTVGAADRPSGQRGQPPPP